MNDQKKPEQKEHVEQPVPQRHPTQVNVDDDNALESLGKAITEPIEGAAEDEDPALPRK